MPLSPLQEERVAALQRRARVTFDDELPQHQVRDQQAAQLRPRFVGGQWATGGAALAAAATEGAQAAPSGMQDVHVRCLQSGPSATLHSLTHLSMSPLPCPAPWRAFPLCVLQAALRELWGAAFPGAPFPPGVRHEQWKQLGFQSDVPARDLSRWVGGSGAPSTRYVEAATVAAAVGCRGRLQSDLPARDLLGEWAESGALVAHWQRRF